MNKILDLCVLRDEDTGKFGYMGDADDWVIKPIFDLGRDFSEGFAAVELDGKWGFIDKSGKVVIEPKYDYVSAFFDKYIHNARLHSCLRHCNVRQSENCLSNTHRIRT